MVTPDDGFRPGQVVPASGIYRCDTGCGHSYASTDVRGHRFPPLPDGCRGGRWVPERLTQRG
jgi:expansin (peptidoglycan-binding protein)